MTFEVLGFGYFFANAANVFLSGSLIVRLKWSFKFLSHPLFCRGFFQQLHRGLVTPAAYKIIIFLCILYYVFLKNEKLFQ